jgi:hypothetical protein
MLDAARLHSIMAVARSPIYRRRIPLDAARAPPFGGSSEARDCTTSIRMWTSRGYLWRGPKSPRAFRYFDKGNMAVVGKNFAIMESGRLRLAGFTAWLVWASVHLMFLPQLQNRLRVQKQWLWSYFTGQRSSRLISEALRIEK